MCLIIEYHIVGKYSPLNFLILNDVRCLKQSKVAEVWYFGSEVEVNLSLMQVIAGTEYVIDAELELTNCKKRDKDEPINCSKGKPRNNLKVRLHTCS